MRLTPDVYSALHSCYLDIISFQTASAPELVLYHDSSNTLLGEYDENVGEILVNVAQHWTPAELLQTIIHEHVHATLAGEDNDYDLHFEAAEDGVAAYVEHPEEILAEKVAAQEYALFLTDELEEACERSLSFKTW